MRRVFYAVGFLLSLSMAAGSFTSIMGNDGDGMPKPAEQTFFIPKSHNAGMNECLADRNNCGRAAAVSFCETNGYSNVVAFGEASPEDLTGSIGAADERISGKAPKELPFLVTCSK